MPNALMLLGVSVFQCASDINDMDGVIVADIEAWARAYAKTNDTTMLTRELLLLSTRDARKSKGRRLAENKRQARAAAAKDT